MEISSGSLVGGYRIVRLLGQGAMGAVYEAQHKTLPRTVALKVMSPAVAGHPELRERFDREAELLCALEHPNIVDALDRGQDGDHLFIAMRYVEGQDLDAALRERGPFPPEQAVEIVATVGRALDHAHSRGLLHRDVKPANIMLRRRDGGAEEAVLTDFGIAASVTSSPLTTDGRVPATVAYTAPERLDGKAADGRADVYSLGAVLFELLAGRRAFPMEEPRALFASVLVGPVPDLQVLRPDLPPALVAVVTKALQKDPRDRPANCAELAAAARAALSRVSPAPPTTVGAGTGPPPPPTPPGPLPHGTGRVPTLRDPHRGRDDPAPERPRRRARWVPVAVVLAVLAGLAAAGIALLTGTSDGGDAAATDDGTQGAPAASAPSASPVAEEPSVPPSSALAVGDCVDADANPTACDGAHAAQVYSTTDCTPEALLAFLGGRPGTDVLRQDLDRRSVGPACTVGIRGVELDGTAEDVLDGPAGEWRRCTDDGEARPCSEPHTGEVVFEQQSSSDPLNCTALAGEYLGVPFSRHVEDLSVREDGTTCLVQVRGSNVLTATLKDLGSSALPLEAA